jgi:hypothetical protein
MEKDGKKISDLIVWDKERGYYARELTYASNVGAPVIKQDDVQTWRMNKVSEINSNFQAKYDEIKKDVEKLIEDYNWNDLIYSKVQYNFQPTIGNLYHLYERKDLSLFLSMISPDSWNQKHIASFRLDSNGKWNKI